MERALTCQECEKLSDIDLLKYYASQWDRYTTGAGYINKLFGYLNKHWVKREKDEGRKEVYTVYTVSLCCPRFISCVAMADDSASVGCLEDELFQVLSTDWSESVSLDASSPTSDRAATKRRGGRFGFDEEGDR